MLSINYCCNASISVFLLSQSVYNLCEIYLQCRRNSCTLYLLKYFLFNLNKE